MSVELIIAQGSHAGTVAPIHPGYYLVGRHSECQIRPKSRSVSRRHCLLLRNEDGFGALDLRSTCGTFINGDKIRPHQWNVLHDGDEIRFGKVAFTVSIRQPVFAGSTAREGVSSAASSLGSGAASSTGDRSSNVPASWNHSDVAGFLEIEDAIEYELKYGNRDDVAGAENRAAAAPVQSAVSDVEVDLFSDDFEEPREPNETFIGKRSDDSDAGEESDDEHEDRGVEFDAAPKKRPPRRQVDPREYKKRGSTGSGIRLPSFSFSIGGKLDWKVAAATLLALGTLILFAYQIQQFQAGPEIQVREGLD
jgi:hypothetical protein